MTHAQVVAIVAKAKEKAERKESAQRKKDYYAKDYSYQFDKTKKAAQKLANRLDAHLPCICCERPRLPGKVFCGGHLKTGKAHSEFALDLCNIHGQENVNCNQHLSGNINGDKNSKGYKQGIIDRYGQPLLDYLESHQPRAKFSCQELIELRAVYAAETRRLEKGLPPTRNWRTPGDLDVLRGQLPCNQAKT